MTVNDDMRIVQVAMGMYHVLALRANGTVIAWGSNVNSQCNVPIDLCDVVAIATGFWHNVALKNNGEVVSWGGGVRNSHSKINNAVGISAGRNFTIGILENGSVISLTNEHGMYININEDFGQHDVPLHLDTVVQIAAGEYHVLALRANGTVVAWGDNRYGQCDIPQDLDNVVQIAAGHNHSVALRSDNTIVAWGNNTSRQCDVWDVFDDVVQIVAGAYHTIAVQKNGHIEIWGGGEFGLFKVPSLYRNVVQASICFGEVSLLLQNGEFVVWKEQDSVKHQIPDDVVENTITHIQLGFNNSAVILQNGKIKVWGENTYHQCNIPLKLATTKQIALGADHVVVLQHNGMMAAWGRNSHEQCVVKKNVVQVAAGYYHTVVVDTDGRVFVNGLNKDGQCNVLDNLPVIHRVTAGGNHTVAVSVTGQVFAWGNNTDKQCNVPERLSDVIDVSAGHAHTVALCADGKVHAWGANRARQCDVPNISIPVTQIASGVFHSLALLANGRVLAWGDNRHGECDVPVDLSDVVLIAAGYGNSAAITRDGHTYIWGGNDIVDTNRLVNIKNNGQLSFLPRNGVHGDERNTIYALSDQYAKKFHSITQFQIETIQYQVAHPLKYAVNQRQLIAWPTSAMYSPWNHELIGYTMPYVDAEPIIHLFNVTRDKPENVAHVLKVGRWCAEVMDLLHAHDYIVGGLTPNKVLVYPEGMVVYIGCDTYIFPSVTRQFLEAPSVYTAPEVMLGQGGFSKESDYFSLAVMLFQLLFEGAHPYQHQTVEHFAPTMLYDMHIQNMMLHHDWMFADVAHVDPLSHHLYERYLQLPIQIRILFSRAFGALPTQRPRPNEWIDALLDWRTQLIPPVINVVSNRFSMSDAHALYIRDDGTVVAWGANNEGQCNVPDGLQDVVQVQAFDTFSLAVMHDGHIRAWGGILGHWHLERLRDVAQIVPVGDNILVLHMDGTVVALAGTQKSKLCEVPNGLHDVVQIATNSEITVALHKDGTVTQWGSAHYVIRDSLRNREFPLESRLSVEGKLKDVVQIVVGGGRFGGFVAVLHTDGLVSTWWWMSDYNDLRVPNGLQHVVQIAAGIGHVVALRANGTVVVWGSNLFGQCDIPQFECAICYISANRFSSCAIDVHGTMYIWGEHRGGTFDPPMNQEPIVQVVAGDEHALALTKSGKMLAWGRNDVGQCNVPQTLPEIVRIASAGLFSVAITRDGSIAYWGSHDRKYRELNLELKKPYERGPGPVPGGFIDTGFSIVSKRIIDVSASGLSLTLLHHDGTVSVACWLLNGSHNIPKEAVEIKCISSSTNYSVVVTRSGYVVGWGVGYKTVCEHATLPIPEGVVRAVAGHRQIWMFVEDGQIIEWGEPSDVAPLLAQFDDIVDIEYPYVLRRNGTVLTQDTDSIADMPVWLRDVTQMSHGGDFGNPMTLALLRSGEIVQWGGNRLGDTHRLVQLGHSQYLQYYHSFAKYKGGEAELFSIRDGLLKKYHTKVPQIAKLRYLIEHPVSYSVQDRPLIIWPQNVAYHPFTTQLIGYVMPFVSAPSLDVVFSPQERKMYWPEFADYSSELSRLILTVARWSAEVLRVIHQNGYVVGDLSPSNILVYPEGTVAYIDCDSYQVGDGSEFPCSYMKLSYCPYDAKYEGGLKYTTHTDSFSLAVVIFQLITGGIHPYQAVPVSPIPRDIYDTAIYYINKNIWPYDPQQTQCAPPPGMQEYYAQLPADVRAFFLRAFAGDPAQRPTPAEWVRVLDAWLVNV